MSTGVGHAAHAGRWVAVRPGSEPLLITETNGIRLVLSGMHNRTFGPYLVAINRIRRSPSAVALRRSLRLWTLH
jgi:hypothetical protein